MRASSTSRKALAALLALAFVLPGAAFAADIYVDDSDVPVWVRPGEEFEVSVVLDSDTTQVGYYYLPINYDPDLLLLKSARGGSSQEFDAPITEDLPFFTYIKAHDENNNSPVCNTWGVITLLYLKFQVRMDAPPGQMAKISRATCHPGPGPKPWSRSSPFPWRRAPAAAPSSWT